MLCAVPLSADQFKLFDSGRGEVGGLSDVHAPVHLELGPSSPNLLFLKPRMASGQQLLPVDSRRPAAQNPLGLLAWSWLVMWGVGT